MESVRIKDRQNSIVDKRINCSTDDWPLTHSKSWGGERYFPGLLRPVLLMIIAVFLVEAFVEYFMTHFVVLALPRHVLLDASGTVLLLVPIFYFILYRPFKKLDYARFKVQNENQLLARKLIRRIEEERRHLAQELHDDFGQVLTALQFGLAALTESCSAGNAQGQGCSQQAEKLTGMIATLGDSVRKFTIGLRPAVLEELGLQAALQVLVEGDLTGLKMEFNEQGTSRRYAPEIELSLFRICQEALNNVTKHAQATRFEIRLCHGEDEVQLEIRDNGCGFDIRKLRSGRDRRTGLGLLGLRERVASIGGQLKLTSVLGSGTIIMVKTPTELQRRRDEADTDSGCR